VSESPQAARLGVKQSAGTATSPPAGPTGRRDRRDLPIAAAIFLTALALRLIYLGEIVDGPQFDTPAVDAGYHDYWAWGLASGDWTPPGYFEDPNIPSRPYFRPPLCPYFLAAVYWVFGHDYVAVRVVQMLLGSVSCVLAYLLAARLFDRATAIVCGFLMAGYWAFIYFDSELREVVLLVLLFLVLMLGLVSLRSRPGAWKALGCGIVLGLAALGKPNTLLLVPVAACWLLAVNRRSVRRRRNLFLAGCFLTGCVGAVAPATIRNTVVGHDLVLVSSNGGINLFIGNNPRATGFDVRLPVPLPEFPSSFDYPEVVRTVAGLEKRPMKHSEVSSYFVGRALDHMKSNPGRTAALLLRKVVLFWGGTEIVSEQDLNAAREESALLSHLPGDFSALFACGVVGLFLALRRIARGGTATAGAKGSLDIPPARADLVLVLLLVATYFVSFLPFFVTARYRVPIIPVVVVFAAFGLVQIARAVLEKRVSPAGLAGAAIVGLYLVNCADYYGVSEDGFKATYDRAVLLGKKGRTEEAIALYRQALGIRPYASKAHNNLALALAERGSPNEAIGHYLEALRFDPGYAEAHNNLGVELLELGELNGALIHLSEACRLKPRLVMARKNLGLALALADRTREAITEYREALRLDPQDAGAHHNLGILLSREGRIEEAIEQYRRALELNPADTSTRQALEAALERQRGSSQP
jgi:Flp pilus assembly protein TadD